MLLATTSPFVEPLKRLPLIRTWRDRRRAAWFLSDEGFTSSYGVFSSFAEARAWLPPSCEFDQEALADEYLQVRMHRVYAYDYPVIHWLDRAFAGGARRVLDLGGSIGVHYYAYRPRMAYPASLRWTVFEVPAIVRVGRALAGQCDSAGSLRFIDTLGVAALEADAWLSSGALQYMESAQPGVLLAACPRRPLHLLFNKLPLYPREDFVTVQNIGEDAYAPYYVYNRERFIAAVERHGYRLVDAWDVPERRMELPGHPERSFRCYSGLYFTASVH